MRFSKLIYNQKIIETPTYIEIWDYEKPILSKKKLENKKRKLDWLNYTEKRTFDELNARVQYDSLKRKQRHYEQKRFDIARLIDMNFDSKTKFLTLTFKQNQINITETNNEFKKFIKRLNYRLYKTKKSKIKYIATREKQKRGAIHYHIILFGFPYIRKDELAALWGHGFIQINHTDVDSIENRGRYLSKYFTKDLDLKEHKKKAFFTSQNLKKPIETKRFSTNGYTSTEFPILFTKDYIRKQPVFTKEQNEFGENENLVEFEESRVTYTKIKKAKEE